ncbi:hypothetical protein OJ998_31075 [Solirubrobacter taibaiensis]|nr:hypothetical protein [Solirubrobacter taibaiensis]
MWCDALQDDSRLTLGVLACLALLVLPAVLLSLGRDVRGPLVLTWAAASVFAPLSLMVLDDPLWLPVAVAAGTGFGLIVAAVEQGRRRATFAAMGALGGAGWFTVLVILLAGVSGSCLD